jgi:hypothetical protein
MKLLFYILLFGNIAGTIFLAIFGSGHWLSSAVVSILLFSQRSDWFGHRL